MGRLQCWVAEGDTICLKIFANKVKINCKLQNLFIILVSYLVCYNIFAGISQKILINYLCETICNNLVNRVPGPRSQLSECDFSHSSKHSCLRRAKVGAYFSIWRLRSVKCQHEGVRPHTNIEDGCCIFYLSWWCRNFPKL